MNEFNEKEYLFITSGILHSLNKWGMILSSSDQSIDKLSYVFDDNVFPPYQSHKFLRDDIIKIRDYLNDYLYRTA